MQTPWIRPKVCFLPYTPVRSHSMRHTSGIEWDHGEKALVTSRPNHVNDRSIRAANHAVLR